MQLKIHLPPQFLPRADDVRTEILRAIARQDPKRNPLGNRYLPSWARDTDIRPEDKIIILSGSDTKQVVVEPLHNEDPARWQAKHRGRKDLMNAVRGAIGNRCYPGKYFDFRDPQGAELAA